MFAVVIFMRVFGALQMDVIETMRHRFVGIRRERSVRASYSCVLSRSDDLADRFAAQPFQFRGGIPFATSALNHIMRRTGGQKQPQPEMAVTLYPPSGNTMLWDTRFAYIEAKHAHLTHLCNMQVRIRNG